MIELMLQAERNLAMGLSDQAERLYRQAIERDPRNAIAVVGLARVALARDDDRAAYQFALDALRIDPENAAAIRMENRLSEILAAGGVEVERDPLAVEASANAERRAEQEITAKARVAPAPAPGRPDYAPAVGTRFATAVAESGSGHAAAETAQRPTDAAPEPQSETQPDETRRPGLLQRLFGRR